jgi:hypothetical protein
MFKLYLMLAAIGVPATALVLWYERITRGDRP